MLTRLNLECSCAKAPGNHLRSRWRFEMFETVNLQTPKRRVNSSTLIFSKLRILHSNDWKWEFIPHFCWLDLRRPKAMMSTHPIQTYNGAALRTSVASITNTLTTSISSTFPSRCAMKNTVKVSTLLRFCWIWDVTPQEFSFPKIAVKHPVKHIWMWIRIRVLIKPHIYIVISGISN